MADYHKRYREENRSSAELAARFLQEGWETDEGLHAIATLHYRGGPSEFDLGRRYAGSIHPEERRAGADILGQLGMGEKTVCDESVPLLIELLRDPADEVIYSAAIALGHRNDPRAIKPLLPLIHHASADVRYGVVAGLSGHENLDAVEGLIQLSRDVDDRTRDWATFGLGRQTSVDSPELRDALVARLTDLDPEARGEAMIGLAMRGDERVRPAIEEALRGPFYGDWAIEAAELLAGPEWIPLLEAQQKSLLPEDALGFVARFESAFEKCRKK